MSNEENLGKGHSSSESSLESDDSASLAKSSVDFWSTCSKKTLGIGHAQIHLYEAPSDVSTFIPVMSERLQEHYIAEEFLRKLGKDKIAGWLRQKVPSDKKIKSGDLGEILATEFVNSGLLPFKVPIYRLRWKDGRNLSMRGEDIIGFQFGAKPLRFLKGEAKSRQRLDANVVAEARAALKKNDGLPLAHTLSFITERLSQAGDDEKATLIEEYVLGELPVPSQVSHLIFTFSQNDPSALLQDDAKQARKPIAHYSVGLKVSNHQGLIEEIYLRATDG